MTKNSKSYKRPVSVRRTNLDPADKKFDLVFVLDHLRYLTSLSIILFSKSRTQVSHWKVGAT